MSLLYMRMHLCETNPPIDPGCLVRPALFKLTDSSAATFCRRRLHPVEKRCRASKAPQPIHNVHDGAPKPHQARMIDRI